MPCSARERLFELLPSLSVCCRRCLHSTPVSHRFSDCHHSVSVDVGDRYSKILRGGTIGVLPKYNLSHAHVVNVTGGREWLGPMATTKLLFLPHSHVRGIQFHSEDVCWEQH